MSSDEASQKIPSNEEIINDLTKDLATECSLADPVPADFEKSDSEHPDDFVDEAVLKDLELTLSRAELDERQQEAARQKKRGNDLFKSASYLESIKIYTDALKLCPLACKEERAVLYSNRAAAKIQIERKKSAIDDCTKAIEFNDKYVRAYLRRGKLYEETEKLDESLEDYKKVLELDPGNQEAVKASARLPSLINERNEKMKTEMLG